MKLHIHLFVLPLWAGGLFSILVTTLAVVWGRWRESAMAVAWALTGYWVPILIREFLCAHWCLSGPSGRAVSVIPGLVMLAICVLGLRFARGYWTLWVGSLVLISVLTDLIAVSVPGVTVWAVGTADLVWWWLMGAVIVWGALGSAREGGAGLRGAGGLA
jgi:hypothetical protein